MVKSAFILMSKLVYSDRYIAVVHKPAGWTVYPEGSGDDAQSWLREKFASPVFPVHRLDKDTCGLLAFARDPRTASAIQAHFRGRQIEKVYRAIVLGSVEKPEGVIKTPLKANKTGRLESAETRFLCLGGLGRPGTKPLTLDGETFSILEVRPQTGRYHQVRRHLREIGHPIAGDARYGRDDVNEKLKKRFGVGRTMLSAVGLAFQHPIIGRAIRIKTTPDPDFEQFRRRLER